MCDLIYRWDWQKFLREDENLANQLLTDESVHVIHILHPRMGGGPIGRSPAGTGPNPPLWCPATAVASPVNSCAFNCTNHQWQQENLLMATSTRHKGVLRISGDFVDSNTGVRVDMPGGSNGSALDLAPPDSSASFTLHFSNIRGLNSNLSSVEQHLGTSLPNLPLLPETQLSRHASTDPFQISHYNPYPRFRSRGGVCAYCNTNTPIARLIDLESLDFDARSTGDLLS
ncbi:hypothetical protein SK128_025653 [Halocaridina rubra]|uniref:Uncharacterized protein n=1 Tax=Halocaridina rubra TaxID=373956 RepID=A0AAN8XBJ4_HALRR